MLKICTNCNTEKHTTLFHKSTQKKDGYRNFCKSCEKEKEKLFYQTKHGVVVRIYKNQKVNSKTRHHHPPKYSCMELEEWMFSQKKFHLIFNNWKRLGYQKDYRPSIDRKNDYLGYTMDNIRITIHLKNVLRGHKDRKNGRNNKQNKEVLQYSKDMDVVGVFHSIHEASRKTGVTFQNISKVCNKERLKSGGYFWSFNDCT